VHYNFLFNGCSWTYGAELESLEKNYEHQKTHRFSHLVSEHFKKTYDNVSQSGISNDSIVEKTIEWFENGNTCDIAIIQFTTVTRTIWYDSDYKKYSISPVLTSNNKKIYSDTIALKTKLYYKTFYSNLLGHQNYYKNLFFLEKYLAEKNIKYLFTKLSISDQYEYDENNENNDYGWKKYCSKIKVKLLKELIGKQTNYQKNTIVNENYCKDFLNKKYPFLNGVHPSELGHQKIANYLIEEINNAHFI